ncbi:MAG: hypothetical protein KDA63_20875 [Planctomycetales bacterium]|nr:hypothetical protein [Planctomycetales bacterium]
MIVLANRLKTALDFKIARADGEQSAHRIEANETMPLGVTGDVSIGFGDGDSRRQYRLSPYRAYFFADAGGRLDLHEIGIGTPPSPPQDAALEQRRLDAPVFEIPVKILVDDENVEPDEKWQAELAGRLKDASDVFERHCRVKFKPVTFERWDSNDSLTEFADTLLEFERSVRPQPAQLAIGFTRQHEQNEGTPRLGGTRGPFHPYILLREWRGRVAGPELTEVLVHELGHYMGCLHSPESTSAMRPKLNDGKAVLRSFRVGFDPLNTLAMYQIGEELRTEGPRRLFGLSQPTKRRLREIYRVMGEAMPEDDAAERFIAALGPVRDEPSSSSAQRRQLVPMASIVMDALRGAAEQNQLLPEDAPKGLRRLSGDRLTEFYVREAANAASVLPETVAGDALLLALGAFMDSSGALGKLPGGAQLLEGLESDSDRQRRLEIMGQPTMYTRPDWTQHFFLSAAIASVGGEPLALALGQTKEVSDSDGGSGFSFADLSADLSGVAFLQLVRRSDPSAIESLSKRFRIKDYLPKPTDLPEGLTAEEFQRDYGSVTDSRFLAARNAIAQSIRELPPYQGASSK